MTSPSAQESHFAHYAGDVISAVGQSPAAIHAFISAFTSHPDPSGTATRPGTIAAVVIILAAITSLVAWVKSKISRSS